MLAAQVSSRRARLKLFQNPDDLFFAETVSPHRMSPQLENRLT